MRRQFSFLTYFPTFSREQGPLLIRKKGKNLVRAAEDGSIAGSLQKHHSLHFSPACVSRHTPHSALGSRNRAGPAAPGPQGPGRAPDAALSSQPPPLRAGAQAASSHSCGRGKRRKKLPKAAGGRAARSIAPPAPAPGPPFPAPLPRAQGTIRSATAARGRLSRRTAGGRTRAL